MLLRSQQIDVVRRAFDLFEMGDIGALVELYHPQVILHTAGVLLPEGTLVGVEDVRRHLQQVVDQGRNAAVDDLELTEAGDQVLVTGRPRLQASGEALDRCVWIFTFDDCWIRIIETFRRAQTAQDVVASLRPAELAWAPLRGREFVLAQLVETPIGGQLSLRLCDGRRIAVPVADELKGQATLGASVLVYFDGDHVAGWYLPEHQSGMLCGERRDR